MIYIEDNTPNIRQDGLNTLEAVDFSSSPSVKLPNGTSLKDANGGMTIARSAAYTVFGGVVNTAIATQNGTPTAAQILGGLITHASTTGAGTLTTPTGTALSAAIAGAASGDGFWMVYANTGNQTVTITAGASGVTLTGTVAVPTGKNAQIFWMCTAANTWIANITLSA